MFTIPDKEKYLLVEEVESLDFSALANFFKLIASSVFLQQED